MSVLNYFKNTSGRPPIGRQAPVAPGGVTAPCRPLQGRQSPFFSRDLVANLKKKNYTKDLSPYGRATGGIFEIIQNGHIF